MDKDKDLRSGFLPEDTTPGYPSAMFNPEDFAEETADWDCSEEDKIEILRIIWNVTRSCVEMQMDVRVVQNFLPQLFDQSVSDSDSLLEEKSKEQKEK